MITIRTKHYNDIEKQYLANKLECIYDELTHCRRNCSDCMFKHVCADMYRAMQYLMEGLVDEHN